MTFKILFYIMKTRVSRNGEVPVLLRVTVNGLRAGATTNFKVDPEQWHSQTGRAIGTDRKSEELNNALDVIRLKLMKIHREMELDGELIVKPFISLKPSLNTNRTRQNRNPCVRALRILSAERANGQQILNVPD